MLDLDHFKMVNDTYGHQTGDLILREMAKNLRIHLRSVDKVFRYGGEEFAVILPETPEKGAKAFADQIRQTIADSSYPVSSDPIFLIWVRWASSNLKFNSSC